MADLDVVLVNVDKTLDADVRAVIDFNTDLEHGGNAAMLGPGGYHHSRRAVSESVQRA